MRTGRASTTLCTEECWAQRCVWRRRYKLSELPDICGLMDVCAAGVSETNTMLVPPLVELINLFQKVRGRGLRSAEGCQGRV